MTHYRIICTALKVRLGNDMTDRVQAYRLLAEYHAQGRRVILKQWEA